MKYDPASLFGVNRLLRLKAYQKNTAQQFVILTDWILKLWKVITLQPCLLAYTCGVRLCPWTPKE